MNDIQVFNNPQFGEVRTAGTAEHPLFCLADVCKAVGLQNPSSVRQRLDKEDVQLIDLHALNSTEGIRVGNSVTNFVTESGFYDVLLQSSSPKVKPFRRWVTSEVLPSIRKHGAYATATTIDSIIADPESGIKLLQALKAEREQRRLAEEKNGQLQLENKEQAEKIKADAPLVTFANAIVGSTTSCLIGELAKILRQNGVQTGEKRLFEWMREKGYLGRHGERYNIPNQEYIERGYFELKKGTRSGNGGVLYTTITTKVTPRGQEYFINKFLKV